MRGRIMIILLSMDFLITYDMNMPMCTCEMYVWTLALCSSIFLFVYFYECVLRINPFSFFKASFCEVLATSSCNNRRLWRYRWAPEEHTSPRAPAPRFLLDMVPRWSLFCLEINIPFTISIVKTFAISSIRPTLSYLTRFIEVYAGIAL